MQVCSAKVVIYILLCVSFLHESGILYFHHNGDNYFFMSDLRSNSECGDPVAKCAVTKQ